jgi:hypothetical protein
MVAYVATVVAVAATVE